MWEYQKCDDKSKCVCSEGYYYNVEEKNCEKIMNIEDSCDDNKFICGKNKICDEIPYLYDKSYHLLKNQNSLNRVDILYN